MSKLITLNSYEEKKKMADEYLIKACGLGWNDLADCNSLNDAETNEDVIDLCKERLEWDGFPIDDFINL